MSNSRGIEKHPHGRGEDHITINDIRTIYPRADEGAFLWVEEGALLGYEKRKGRDWLANMGANNTLRPQAKATLDNAIVYDTPSATPLFPANPRPKRRHSEKIFPMKNGCKSKLIMPKSVAMTASAYPTWVKLPAHSVARKWFRLMQS
ncbi:MAG: hypothetical protein L0H15_07615 [Nitrosospira sp.]|nr:hypothetical protein [Nitrosospira sp.]MDN5935454.1 hypothetical protein [Nitrosospira sp.]